MRATITGGLRTRQVLHGARNFEIGRILPLKSEIRDLKLDRQLRGRITNFEISDLRYLWFGARYSLLNPVRSFVTVKLPSVRAESFK